MGAPALSCAGVQWVSRVVAGLVNMYQQEACRTDPGEESSRCLCRACWLVVSCGSKAGGPGTDGWWLEAYTCSHFPSSAVEERRGIAGSSHLCPRMVEGSIGWEHGHRTGRAAISRGSNKREQAMQQEDLPYHWGRKPRALRIAWDGTGRGNVGPKKLEGREGQERESIPSK